MIQHSISSQRLPQFLGPDNALHSAT